MIRAALARGQSAEPPKPHGDALFFSCAPAGPTEAPVEERSAPLLATARGPAARDALATAAAAPRGSHPERWECKPAFETEGFQDHRERVPAQRFRRPAAGLRARPQPGNASRRQRRAESSPAPGRGARPQGDSPAPFAFPHQDAQPFPRQANPLHRRSPALRLQLVAVTQPLCGHPAVPGPASEPSSGEPRRPGGAALGPRRRRRSGARGLWMPAPARDGRGGGDAW